MKILVLTSKSYNKKNSAGEKTNETGEITNIFYMRNFNGVLTPQVQTVFGTGVLEEGTYYNIEFGPNNSIVEIKKLEKSEGFGFVIADLIS